MKRTWTAILAGALSLSMLGGCASGNPASSQAAPSPAPSGEAPSSSQAPASSAGEDAQESSSAQALDFSQKVDIEYLGWSNNKLDGTDPVFKAIEEKFNMNLTYSSVPTGEYANFLSMRIASGDIPEMFKTEAPSDNGMLVYRQLVQDGVIINLSDYIEQYHFDNLKEMLSADTAQMLREEDGFYMVPNYLGPSLAGMYVREDWMEQLGFEAPKTLDEYRDFLKAAVTADPDGRQTTGLTLPGVGGLESIFSAFTGKSGNWVEYEGDYVHKVMLPAFKEGVRFCAELYSEGLLDPEFAIMNNTTIQEKISSGKAASLILNATAAWYNPMVTALAAYKPEAKITVLPGMPAGPAGEIKNGGIPYFGAVHIFSDTTEEQRVRILAFLDWLLTDDCLDLFYYGTEGDIYTLQNGEKLINQEAKNEICFGRDLYLFYDIINNSSQFKVLAIEPLVTYRQWSTEHSVYDEVVGLANDTTMDIAPRLTDVYNKWIVDFVTGSADIDSQWEAFIAEFKSVGYDDYHAEVVSYMAS